MCWKMMRCATALKPISNWPTIPQLYVKGEFVGGCDIIREMFEEGELRPYLTEKGISLRRRKRRLSFSPHPH